MAERTYHSGFKKRHLMPVRLRTEVIIVYNITIPELLHWWIRGLSFSIFPLLYVFRRIVYQGWPLPIRAGMCSKEQWLYNRAYFKNIVILLVIVIFSYEADAISHSELKQSTAGHWTTGSHVVKHKIYFFLFHVIAIGLKLYANQGTPCMQSC